MRLEVSGDHLRIIRSILKEHVPDHHVVAFGSRTDGSSKPTSDLDLCIMTNHQLSFATLANLKDAFSLSIIPYKIDVIDWSSISHSFQEIIKDYHVTVQDEALAK